jgi:hypothetical protein
MVNMMTLTLFRVVEPTVGDSQLLISAQGPEELLLVLLNFFT